MTDFNPAELKQFTGSQEWFRHTLNRSVLFTEGAKWVADKAGSYWLLDEIVLAQMHVRAVKTHQFQVWRLVVANRRGTLICEDGNDQQVYSKEILFTDFPSCGVTLWFTDGVILLPSEY